MLFDAETLPHSIYATIFLVGSALVIRCLFREISDPLRTIPGPSLARHTRLWELYKNWEGRLEHVTIDLHKRYGSIVRLAPGRYSISDPAAIRIIYGPGSKFNKSRFYIPFGAPNADHKDVFSERDNTRHATERRRIANMYAMSSLVSYEPFVDSVNSRLMAAMSTHAQQGRIFDLFTWMQFYAFDVIGEITIGRSFGLLEAGYDKDALLHAIHIGTISYGSMAALIPGIHSWFLWLQALTPFTSYLKVTQQVIQKEVEARMGGATSSGREDFLEKCIKANKTGKMDRYTTNNVIGSNIGAGSDTTGISLTAVVYFLMHNPSCLRRLRSEIDVADKQGMLSNPVTFQEGQKLPYLQATIKEALRLHPAVGQILSRVVPKGGAEIAGRHFPQGSVVGINAWVIHRDEKIWGEDVLEFRPERWLVDKTQLSFMEQHFLSFGAGARTCIGKNISLLEMTKVLPELVRKFDFSTGSQSQWKTRSGWFVKQEIGVSVSNRAHSSQPAARTADISGPACNIGGRNAVVADR